ncbi:MAG: murein DD-endopeptidase MepM/ murein hydrolase activator NlpD, partial [Candidatus Azotimanducaceae bacterium]
VDMSETVETELTATKNSKQESDVVTAGIKILGQQAHQLNDQTNELIHAATATIEESKQYNQQTESLISSAQNIQRELENLRDEVRAAECYANDAASFAHQAVDDITAVKVGLIAATQQTETVTAGATAKIEALSAISMEAESINASTKLAQEELRQAVTDSRDINDEFMRGLEAVSKQAKQTDQDANQVLSDTRSLQDEITNILQLRHGINGFQQSVDICQERLQDLTSSVALCQEDTAGQADLIGQYQRRIDAFQGDVSRYRDSVMQFETRARQLESNLGDVNSRLEENDQLEQERLAGQVEKIRKLEFDMRNSLSEKQIELDNSINELQAKTEKQLETISSDILKDVEQRLQSVNDQTDARLIKTSETIQDLGSDFNNLNRSLMDEIRALKTQTSAVKEQHGVFQQEQRTQIGEQKKRTQNQDYELDTIRHQLENYQRLLETQFDNQPHQELQQRVKSIEGNLRQHQRMLKVHESKQEKLGQDDRVEALKQTVDAMGRSLDDTKINNQNLLHNNQTLEATLQSRQEEVNNCFQRIQRLEAREANFEEMITALKSRDSDTQQTLLQMRSAVKDSTRAMRETQKTLERLNQPERLNIKEETEKKRDWLSAPKQAVMTSLFAALITGLTFLGYDEVDASFLQDEPIAVLSATPRLLAQPPQRVSLDKTLSSLTRANTAIADLGEFAWPVNFGIVDPEAIEYRSHHQGISIKGELGDPVVAVNDGKVIFSGNEIRGYGNMIVIQHDDDLVSIYANNQFNYVAEGDSIRRGQLIGDIGQLFNEDAAGLYFEIRHNGEPEDPFNYLRGNQSMDLLTAR